jgi:hypothetical protein
LRIWALSISPALGSGPRNGDNTKRGEPYGQAGKEHVKNVIRVFFILTIALITVAILRSFL